MPFFCSCQLATRKLSRRLPMCVRVMKCNVEDGGVRTHPTIPNISSTYAVRRGGSMEERWVQVIVSQHQHQHHRRTSGHGLGYSADTARLDAVVHCCSFPHLPLPLIASC